ncbi:E3 ubiquitin-protein ligase TRIM71-like [Acropora millepora]|uniref:E3 ubiquitin-protein ligase TRIM71-like n=1 Tax=Acropora millepora TaxID=45264 RepID=UPI001CF4E0A7|nr:E3 ubiquitin-protein ligase TRIM71-like [Acropora millepora]
MDVQEPVKTKKEAECPLCANTLNNPRTLPCLHSFCLGCLDKQANLARRQRQQAIKCPACQASLQIPKTDTFAKLPSPAILSRLVNVLALEDGTAQSQKCSRCDKNNLLTSYCLVCLSFVCESCSHSHQCRNATTNDERPVMCSQQNHEDQPLALYCQDCEVLICQKCSVVSHNRHSMTGLKKAAQERSMQMAEAVAKVRAEILVVENKIKMQTELKNKSETVIMNAKKKMNDTVEESVRSLLEHQKKMNDKFRGIDEAERRKHAVRLEDMERIATELKSFVKEVGQGILQRNISAEILQKNPMIAGRCDELLNARKPNLYMSPYLNYFVENKFDLLDQILVTKTDPSMCLIEAQDSLIGIESEFVVVTRDSEGLQCYQQEDQIKVEMLTPEGDHLRTELKDSRDGKYTVTYTPQCAGQHRLEVQVNKQLLTVSPFVVQVRDHQYQFGLKFGSAGNREGEFHLICDIAVCDKTGTIAVADHGNKRIQLFSSDGKFQRQVELDGKPFSLAFTDCGDLLTLVANGNMKSRLFIEGGHFIKRINSQHLRKSHRLSIASDGRLIITDTADHKIKVFSPDENNLLQSFFAPNCDKDPECAIYHQNRFYVSYPAADCVKVFNETGMYLHDIGCKGAKDGQFNCPRGLVIDKYNRLIVCDVRNRRLQLFTLSGKFLGKVQGEYFNNGIPMVAAINKNDNILFLGDNGSNSIYVFH